MFSESDICYGFVMVAAELSEISTKVYVTRWSQLFHITGYFLAVPTGYTCVHIVHTYVLFSTGIGMSSNVYVHIWQTNQIFIADWMDCCFPVLKAAIFKSHTCLSTNEDILCIKSNFCDMLFISKEWLYVYKVAQSICTHYS